MNYKIFAVELFAILASYLILTLPVAYAQSFSDYLPDEDRQQQPKPLVEQADSEPIQKSFIDFFASSLPEMLSEFFSIFSNIISEFADNLFPGVRAQGYCGDNNCIGYPDEWKGNCCFDCPCESGWYCDFDPGTSPVTGNNCRVLNEIELNYISPSSITFSNCNDQHEINLTVEVKNPPNTMEFESKGFTLNNGEYSGTIWGECSGSGSYPDYYKCPVIIPSLGSSCTEGQHVLTQNLLEFNITFYDGPSPIEKSLTIGFPDITISSFDCGNGVYEPELGEDKNNCCYDAPCDSGWYCDISNEDRNLGNYDAGSCDSILNDNDLKIKNAGPLHFPSHQSGDAVSFFAEIRDKPKSLTVTGDDCSIENASCSLSCSNVPSSDTDIYNMSCSLTFTITGYDESQSYSLSPDINISVTYNNASGTISDILSKTNTFTISIRETVCGDGYAGSGETRDNCCYDVPCDSGWYCDITDDDINSGNYDAGECKQDNTNFIIDNINPTEFTAYTIKEEEFDESGVQIDTMVTESLVVNVISHINNIPKSRKSIEPYCDFDIEDIECMVQEPCKGELVSSDTLNIECNIIIPNIKYKELGSAYYNSQTKQITLNTNMFGINITFNNGSSEIKRSLRSNIDPIIINVKSGCGNGICETDLDERTNTCCHDCGCPESSPQCIGEPASGENECINPETIVLDIRVPDQDCEIKVLNRDCIFLDGIHFTTTIYNPPDDLEIVDTDRVGYMIVDTNNDFKPHVTCQSVSSPANTQKYICSIKDFPNIKHDDTDTSKKITVQMDVVYGGGTPKRLTDSDTFRITRETHDEVRTCVEEKGEIEKWEEDAIKKGNWFDWVKIIVGFAAAAAAVTCAVCTALCAFGVGCGCAAWSCPLAIGLGFLSCVLGKIKTNAYYKSVEKVASVKTKFDAVCGSRGVSFTQSEFEERINNIRDSITEGVGFWDPVVLSDFASDIGCLGGTLASVVTFIGPQAAQAATNVAGTEAVGSALGDWNVPSGTYA